jgi:hypothetical protein
LFNNVILGLKPRIQPALPPLDSRLRGNDTRFLLNTLVYDNRHPIQVKSDKEEFV